MVAVNAPAQLTRLNAETGQKEELQYYIGGYGALNINFHTTDFGTLPGIPSCCNEYNNNSKLGPAFGALVEIPLTRLLRLQFRAGYSTLSGTLLANETIGNEPVLDDGPVPTERRRDIRVEHSLDASIPLIVAEPALSFQVFDLLWFTAGMRGAFAMKKTFEQKETLVSPDGYVFLNGTAVRNQYSGDIPDAKTFHVHGMFGLGYEIATKTNLRIVPEVRYYLPLHKVASVDWAVQSFQIGVALKYGIYAPVDPTIKNDTIYRRDTVVVERPGIREDRVVLTDRTSSEERNRQGDVEYRVTTVKETYTREVPRAYSPDIQLSAFTTDKDGVAVPVRSIRVQELDVIESYPLLPQVFFPEGSADLSQASASRLTADETRDFRPNELSRDQLDVYRNLLNVVGSRMRSNPKLNITVTGCTSNQGVEQNNRQLAKERADAVKQYLVDVWGVDQGRIGTASRLLPANPANPQSADGRQENQRVEIAANDLSTLEPVEFRDRDLTITPKEVRLRPTVSNGEDIASWNFDLKQKDRSLLVSEDKGQPREVTWTPSATDRNLKDDGPVKASLSVSNGLGQSKTASTELPVDYVSLQTIKSSSVEGKRIERYSLIVFDYNSAQLNPSNQRLMQRVKERIQPDSKVRITGFADRQGEATYNRELARRRCVEAQRVLGIPDSQVTIDPQGSDRLLYDNDRPEGRSYSRTVQIEIETPTR